MKVVFHEDFYQVYASDPAAEAGRMEAIVAVLEPHVEFVTAEPATEEQIAAVHTAAHIERVRQMGLYDIAALAAGGAVQAAAIGLTEPCFALIRPPGHHASAGSPRGGGTTNQPRQGARSSSCWSSAPSWRSRSPTSWGGRHEALSP